jgi:hypothetical protein
MYVSGYNSGQMEKPDIKQTAHIAIIADNNKSIS